MHGSLTKAFGCFALILLCGACSYFPWGKKPQAPRPEIEINMDVLDAMMRPEISPSGLASPRPDLVPAEFKNRANIPTTLDMPSVPVAPVLKDHASADKDQGQSDDLPLPSNSKASPPNSNKAPFKQRPKPITPTTTIIKPGQAPKTIKKNKGKTAATAPIREMPKGRLEDRLITPTPEQVLKSIEKR